MTRELRDFMWQHKDELESLNPDWDMIFKDAHEELDKEVVKEFVNLLSNSKAKNLNIDIVKRTCVLQELLNNIIINLFKHKRHKDTHFFIASCK